MPERILIVDDHEENIYLLRALLEGNGYGVESAFDGSEALKKARQAPPDLIVTDILMPVMDGYTLCREWKSDDLLKHIPLIFYTATYTKPKDEQFALSLGADRFVIKPQEPHILMKIFREVLNRNHSIEQAGVRPLGEEMEFFRQYNEILFEKLEKKISDLETANKQLSLLEEKYRLSFENVTDVIYMIDTDLSVLNMSPSVEKILGYKPEELIGRPVFDLKHIFLPDSYEKAVSDTERILKGQSIPTAIYRFLSKDGAVKYGDISGSPVMHEGKITGMIAVARDITDRKQAEEASRESGTMFRTLVEHAFDSTIIINLEGTILFANNSAARTIQAGDAHPLVGRNVMEFVAPESREDVLNDFQELAIGHDSYLAEYSLITEKGERIRMESVGKRIVYEGTTAVLASMRDITDRMRAAKEKETLQDQLRQAQKMESIGALAGGIAHDFNNILSAIIGYTELYKEQVRDRPKVYRGMEEVLKAAGRARDLVQQILTFSRQAVREKRPTAIIPILNEVARFIRASLPSTIEIRQKLNATSDVVMADATHMHQLLMNLCTNAGHAMAGKGGALEIGLEEVAIGTDTQWLFPTLAGGRYLKLDVRDTGHGIKAEHLEKIFDPYFTTKAKGEGTGLGLAVVHGIAKDHGGEVKVYSEIDKGTCFSVYLPLMEKQAETILPAAEVSPPRGSERILFIDDEEPLADLAKEMLLGLGYRVVSETDPLKAIEVFGKNSDAFDLVITDKTMPHMTGFAVARDLHKIRADIPVILCSGFQEKEDLEKQSACGISSFIMKPFRINNLAEAIRSVLGKKE
ncbi:MAG: response regulator [Syntrophales bacterium]